MQTTSHLAYRVYRPNRHVHGHARHGALDIADSHDLGHRFCLWRRGGFQLLNRTQDRCHHGPHPRSRIAYWPSVVWPNRRVCHAIGRNRFRHFVCLRKPIDHVANLCHLCRLCRGLHGVFKTGHTDEHRHRRRIRRHATDIGLGRSE